ncbi:uncharacterized protein LOC131227485 [Magnolia sinica]|uniref:uncharacterized protein LOC131227485 n=1 Tax=Magnolia sinica TaxID=86752 RepID=UPI00265A40AA|nr:uncharacterized protein LOC131227485 [Magnolia sinica]
MNSLSFPLSSLFLSTTQKIHLFPLYPHQYKKSHTYPLPLSFCPSQTPSSSPSISASSQIPLSAIPIEEIVEKDWSFLEPTDADSDPNLTVKTSRIISAAQIKPNSRILVSLGSEGFVDRLVESLPSDLQLLLVVHESLFVLAGIKEKYDDGIRCWQGGIVEVPEKWAPFDTIFLCYLPGLDSPLDQILGAIAEQCSEGARLVIGFAQGREAVERHRQQYPEMVTSDLPDKVALEKAAATHLFQVTEFIDEPAFYLAVLNFRKVGNSTE